MSNRSGKTSGDANVLIPFLGRVTVLVGIVFSTFGNTLCAQTHLPGASVVYEVMRRVNDYWIANSAVGNPGDATTFSDADPLSDGKDYMAGTSPADGQGVPKLQLISLGDGRLPLGFIAPAALGVGYPGLEQRYALEQKFNLQTGSWTVVTSWEGGAWRQLLEDRGDSCGYRSTQLSNTDLAATDHS